MDGILVSLVLFRRIRDGDVYGLETFAGARRRDDELDTGAWLDAAVLVWGYNLLHVEVVSLGCSVAGRVERDDEAVAAVRFAIWWVQVALAGTG